MNGRKTLQSFVKVDISRDKFMCHIVLFFILSAILISSGLQKPAPVLFKYEGFYGRRDLEHTREYHLIRENVDSSIRKENRKAFVDKVYNNNAQNVCKFVMPVKGTAISSDKICQDGIKIIAQNGTNVIASPPGKVIYVGKGEVLRKFNYSVT